MNTHRLLHGLILAVTTLAVCRGAAAPLKVSVSIPPLQGLAASLGGEWVTISSFMGENQDPHTFTPAPRAVAELGECAVFFAVGIDFEAALCAKVKATFPALEIVDVTAGLERSPGASHEGHEAETHRGTGHAEAEAESSHSHAHVTDPHLWLSVPNLSHMAGVMAETLKRRLPEHREAVDRNLARLTAELAATHAEFGRQLAPLRGSTFYVYHPSFGYFARDYGLVQEAVEIDGKSPTPRQLTALIAQAAREKVKVIFVQPQFSERTARILAERIGGDVIAINHLTPDPVGALRQAVAALVRTQSPP